MWATVDERDVEIGSIDIKIRLEVNREDGSMALTVFQGDEVVAQAVDLPREHANVAYDHPLAYIYGIPAAPEMPTHTW